jgi:hypothetical protein
LLHRSFLVLSSTICQSFLLVAEPLGYYLGSNCACKFPCFSYSSCCFKVSGLISGSLIYFELILIQGERHVSSFSIFACRYLVFQATFVEEGVFLHHMFWAPLSKIRLFAVFCASIWTLGLIFQYLSLGFWWELY